MPADVHVPKVDSLWIEKGDRRSEPRVVVVLAGIRGRAETSGNVVCYSTVGRHEGRNRAWPRQVTSLAAFLKKYERLPEGESDDED